MTNGIIPFGISKKVLKKQNKVANVYQRKIAFQVVPLSYAFLNTTKTIDDEPKSPLMTVMTIARTLGKRLPIGMLLTRTPAPPAQRKQTPKSRYPVCSGVAFKDLIENL